MDRHAVVHRGRRFGSVFLFHLHEDVARGHVLLARLDEHHPKPLRVEQRPVEVTVLLGFHQMKFAGLGDEGADEPLLALIHLGIAAVASGPFPQSPAGSTVDQSVLIHFEHEVLVGVAAAG